MVSPKGEENVATVPRGSIKRREDYKISAQDPSLSNHNALEFVLLSESRKVVKRNVAATPLTLLESQIELLPQVAVSAASWFGQGVKEYCRPVLAAFRRDVEGLPTTSYASVSDWPGRCPPKASPPLGFCRARRGSRSTWAVNKAGDIIVSWKTVVTTFEGLVIGCIEADFCK